MRCRWLSVHLKKLSSSRLNYPSETNCDSMVVLQLRKRSAQQSFNPLFSSRRWRLCLGKKRKIFWGTCEYPSLQILVVFLWKIDFSNEPFTGDPCFWLFWNYSKVRVYSISHCACFILNILDSSSSSFPSSLSGAQIQNNSHWTKISISKLVWAASARPAACPASYRHSCLDW